MAYSPRKLQRSIENINCAIPRDETETHWGERGIGWEGRGWGTQTKKYKREEGT